MIITKEMIFDQFKDATKKTSLKRKRHLLIELSF